MRSTPMTFVWLALSGCPISEPERTCEQVEAEFQSERAELQSCEQDRECGQVLEGTSCGCTRNLVARNDADTTVFYDLLDEMNELECDAGLTSVCDCPMTAGFRCDDGTCVHNNVDDYPHLPVCYADNGDPLEIDAVVLEGDELVVTVSYGGGCETHDITLCWPDQHFMESDPVQVNLEIFHDAHDDACEAYITEDRRLSVAPLRDAWHEAYGPGAGVITMHIGGLSLDYLFE